MSKWSEVNAQIMIIMAVLTPYISLNMSSLNVRVLYCIQSPGKRRVSYNNSFVVLRGACVNGSFLFTKHLKGKKTWTSSIFALNWCIYCISVFLSLFLYMPSGFSPPPTHTKFSLKIEVRMMREDLDLSTLHYIRSEVSITLS